MTKSLLICSFGGAINVYVLTVYFVCIKDAALALGWTDTKECTVNLTTDSPAVVGAPIGFFARLQGVKDNSTLFTYRWESILAKFERTVYNQSLECNVTINKVEKEGIYEMKVWVDRSDGVKLCKAFVSFHITSSINGLIKVEQKGTHAKMNQIISTTTPANVSFAIHDPQNYFNNSYIFYGWAIDSETLKITESSFLYNFSSPVTYHVMLVVTVIVSEQEKPRAYFGTFSIRLDAKNPIVMSNVTGETSIQHGDLLDISISCEGSVPVLYCWYFTQSAVNTSTEVCPEAIETSNCEFFIVRYFKKSGNYKLVLIVDNDVDHKVNVYNINVFQRGAEPQLSPIIVPLACSSVAVVIVIIGIMYYIQTRRSYMVEVADFDFQLSDSYEFQTFGERMVEACKVWCGRVKRKHEISSVYRRIQAQIT